MKFVLLALEHISDAEVCQIQFIDVSSLKRSSLKFIVDKIVSNVSVSSRILAHLHQKYSGIFCSRDRICFSSARYAAIRRQGMK